jgi:NAD(P)-dependent dehydrogenase (short-subunit alcohol dehydrogenase family)
MLRHTLELSDLPAAGPPGDLLAGRHVLVLNGTAGWREAVRSAVVAHGGTPTVWVDHLVEPPDGYPGIDVIVDLGVAEPATDGEWREPMRRTIAALRWVYDDWAAEVRADRLYYVAVTVMGGSMGLQPVPGARPLGGLWAGLAKTLPREFPACNPLVVDVAPDVNDLGEVVLAEVAAYRLLEVGRIGARRVTLMPRERPVDGDPIELGCADLLLFTGGARGIGFEIALEMAAGFGCEVVVTGRSPLPGPDATWLAAPDDEFTRIERALYQHRGDTPILEIRRQVTGMRQAREIWRNLSRARGRGLRLRYQACDVTDPAEVTRLVAELGERLSVVVHNAGVDHPARLPKKPTAEFLAVIEVKVDGLRNLLAALDGRRLKLLCAVGSQTGRFGGTPGQLDYAAANEGLARLATWAGHRLGYPVKTLAWPTWDGLGLITNLAAAARYMRPIAVSDGVRAWRRELTRKGTGEIGFLGEIGDVAPQYLYGIPLPPGWPGRQAMLTRRFQLGEVIAYAPGRLLETRHDLHADWATCLHDTRADDAPAVPIWLALEYLYAAGGWLTPLAGDAPGHRHLRDVWIRPAALRLAAGADTVTLTRRAQAGWDGAAWVIRVSLWRDGDCAAEGRVVDTDRARDDPAPAAPTAPSGHGPPPDAPPAYRWKPLDLEGSGWSACPGGWVSEVAPASPLDLFTLREPPTPQLPANHLEAVVAASPVSGAEVWTLGSGWFDRSCHEAAATVRTGPDRRHAVIAAHDGRIIAVLRELGWWARHQQAHRRAEQP